VFRKPHWHCRLDEIKEGSTEARKGAELSLYQAGHHKKKRKGKKKERKLIE
jgi:hypothetical protein